MFGIGGPEIIVLIALAVWVYGLVMTIDAIRRPASQYRFGNKAAWAAGLVVLNPIILRFMGATIWVVGSLLYLLLVIAYHLAIRRCAGSRQAAS